MAKKKKQQEEEIIEVQKDFVINNAAINDDFCNYSFEILNGVGVGDTHNVKGKGIIDQDLSDAFTALNFHLAAIDDAFNYEYDADIKKLLNNKITGQYSVSGFKIKGSQEDESIVLVGSKSVTSSHERMELSTPRIPLTMSSYKWIEHLKDAAYKVRLEVELYKAGKCTAPEEEEKVNPKQLKITDVTDAQFEDAAI